MTEDIDLIRVTGVEYVKGYTMRLEFSNGKVKLVNFLPLLKGSHRKTSGISSSSGSLTGRSNGTMGQISLRITCTGMGWRRNRNKHKRDSYGFLQQISPRHHRLMREAY